MTIFSFCFQNKTLEKKRRPDEDHGEMIQMFFNKNRTLKKYSLGKGKARENIQLFSKNKTLKNYSLGKDKASDDIQFFSKNKTLNKYSLGRDMAQAGPLPFPSASGRC